MKVSEQWIREWVDPPVDAQTIATQLTTVGLEVDSVRAVVDVSVDGIVVACVTQVKPHPEAERLRLCEVDAGTGETVQVVCGAPNVRVGLIAAYAPVGAKVAGGKKIRASKIRGQQSMGMLCSPVEIGLGEESEGLMELGPDGVPGTLLESYLGLDDHAIEVDLTPNRGDCLSHLGIAREIGVINLLPIRASEVPPVLPTIDEVLPVELAAGVECSRYVGRVIRDINPDAVTPAWMKERLRRCDVRSISPVVDVTNYVMLELGQPMHGFDLEQIAGGIIVRKGRKSEELVLLDEQKLELDEDILVIADHSRPVALAGIMGGLRSAVSATTRHVFLESAYFEPRHVAGDARRYGLNTDASHRFERGVDPQHQDRAVERATRLLLDIVGGEPGPLVDVRSTAHLFEREPVTLRHARLSRVLGGDFDPDLVGGILKRLGLGVEVIDGGWRVRPPGYRFDIAIEADLIEEIARITGYDKLPTRQPNATLVLPAQPEAVVGMDDVRRVLVNRGYREAVTYSFVEAGLQARFDTATPIELANPISSDMTVMRTSLWPGLMQAAIYNMNRQRSSLRLFETGLVFGRCDNEITQVAKIAGLITGTAMGGHWAERPRTVDFFDLKGDVQSLLSLGKSDEWLFKPQTRDCLHSGQSACVYRKDTPLGWVGMVSPELTRQLKVDGEIFIFELDLATLRGGIVPRFEVLSKYPGVKRDIAIVLDEGVSAQAVWDCVGQQRIDVLKNLELFDVYRGEGIDPGKKSYALSLTFQSSQRTLNDEEIELLVASVLDALESGLGANLRG